MRAVARLGPRPVTGSARTVTFALRSWSDPRVLAGVAAAGVAVGLSLGGGGPGPAGPGRPAAMVRHGVPPPLPDLRPREAPDLRWAVLLPQPRSRPRPMPAVASAGDLGCLTDAVYYEARGEPADGQAAVAQVVLNRTRQPGFPKSVCGVVFQRAKATCQFSFACDGSVTGRREPEAWRRARLVAARALDGYRLSEIGEATHFHVAGLVTGWNGRLMQVARIGAHVFYSLTRRPRAPTVETAAYPLPAAVGATPAPEVSTVAAPDTVALAPGKPA